MTEENLPIEDNSPEPEEDAPVKLEGKKAEFWEFTCRTCNGKFAANVYEPRYCLHCGADLHFE